MQDGEQMLVVTMFPYVIAKVKLKLRLVAKKDQRALPLDVGKLKDPNVRKTYQTEIRNRFAVLLDQQEMDLSQFNQILVEAGKKILGPRRRRRMDYNGYMEEN